MGKQLHVLIMDLPGDFIALMREHLGSDTAQSLCDALMTTVPEVSVRLNRRKWDSQWQISVPCQPVAWCPDAYYLSQRPAFTFDPLLHAGAYYVQEASSMYIATLLERYFQCTEQGVTALDLCAAPGGKSTLLAGLLPAGSLLISNEPMPKRAQVLAENMTKWTRMAEGSYPVASVVTQNYPADFSALNECVDLLLTDVPCSGEGMFRKDDVAVQDWSLENVDLCWHRQRDILEEIWHVLKPGGLLLYSTCTFNRFEDEENACWICSQLGAELLEERHFLPGRDRGEGFYVAAIRKGGDMVPEVVVAPRLRGLHILYDSRSMEPLEGPHIELNYQEALQYLRREAIRVEAPRGPVVLCYKGLVLGPGKGVGNRINNLYPDPWRIRTTYTTPFSISQMSDR